MTDQHQDPSIHSGPTDALPKWGWLRRFAFRFALLYIVLLAARANPSMSFPLNLLMSVPSAATQVQDRIEGIDSTEEPTPAQEEAHSKRTSVRVWKELGRAVRRVADVWNGVVPWVDANVLRNDREWVDERLLPGHKTNKVSTQPGGSGDRAYNWVRTFTALLMALFGALLWSVIDRRPRRHWRLLAGLTIYVRYYVALTMLSYGFAKVFPLQFPEPFLSRLVQPYGESSPMGLVWTFMGTSQAYTAFAGAAEVLGGLLLLFRRTTTLGALVTIAVMGNVAAMNFCYDVPVKLFSAHLMLLGVLLVAFDWRRVVGFLVLNRGAAPAQLPAPFTGRWWSVIGYAAKVMFVAAILFTSINGGFLGMKMRAKMMPKALLEGIYEVESFTRNGAAETALDKRWRRLIVNAPNRAVVTYLDDQRMGCEFAADTDAKKVTFATFANRAQKSELAYEQTDGGGFALRGKLGEDAVEIRMKRRERSDFLLLNRGFHWVSEWPWNR